ncbi:MAG: adenine phosphoribosyltransferase [Crocinitomicaceae bacterium]|nr:adenine phosphoribosyltransferase [Crocinitomicaceae bacterium]
MTLQENIKNNIIDVIDFPKQGVSYKDITPIFQNPELCAEILKAMKTTYISQHIEAIVGLESRGFMFGFSLAVALEVPFILIRKKGKLPRATYSTNYALEYGNATIEMHNDAIHKGQRVLIHDDVLATGGTAAAAANLIQQAGGTIAGFHFLVELSFLNGRTALGNFNADISTFASY